MPQSRRRPWFSIRVTKSALLEEHGCDPWAYEAVTLLRFLDKRDRSLHSEPLGFRLDTGAFVSVIPEIWLRNKGLKRFLGPLSAPIPFATAAGEGEGRLARGVLTQFTMDLVGVYPFDFLISPNLNRRDYGLLALRDVMRNFAIQTKKKCLVDQEGRPIEIPDITLIP